jgi:hypothetical protein
MPFILLVLAHTVIHIIFNQVSTSAVAATTQPSRPFLLCLTNLGWTDQITPDGPGPAVLS